MSRPRGSETRFGCLEATELPWWSRSELFVARTIACWKHFGPARRKAAQRLQDAATRADPKHQPHAVDTTHGPRSRPPAVRREGPEHRGRLRWSNDILTLSAHHDPVRVDERADRGVDQTHVKRRPRTWEFHAVRRYQQESPGRLPGSGSEVFELGGAARREQKCHDWPPPGEHPGELAEPARLRGQHVVRHTDVSHFVPSARQISRSSSVAQHISSRHERTSPGLARRSPAADSNEPGDRVSTPIPAVQPNARQSGPARRDRDLPDGSAVRDKARLSLRSQIDCGELSHASDPPPACSGV